MQRIDNKSTLVFRDGKKETNTLISLRDDRQQ